MQSSLRPVVRAGIRQVRCPQRASSLSSATRYSIITTVASRNIFTVSRACCATAPSLLRVARRYNSTDSSSSEQPGPQTHYEFFPKTLPEGPPPTGPFVIDVRQLRKEFLQLQAKAHPDMHPQENKRKAEGLSARINEAYKTLQNPLLRAQYLLSLRGIDVAEDETAKVEDPELLMEVLDAREEIEAAQEEEELDDMKRTNDDRISESETILDSAFRDDDMAIAMAEAVKLRYWVNIKDSLDGWEKGKPVVLEH